MAKKILRLDQIQSPIAGTMEFNGKCHDVRQPTIGVQQVLVAIENDPTSASLAEMHAAIRSLVPSLSDEEFKGLDDFKVQAIVALATGPIEAVEKLFPNAVSPEIPPTSPG